MLTFFAKDKYIHNYEDIRYKDIFCTNRYRLNLLENQTLK